MRSMPVANNLHNENRPKRHTSDIGHTKETKQKEEGKGKRQKTRWNIKLNHQPKKRQRRRSFILGDSNWKFFQVGYPVDTPTDMNLLLRVSVTHRPALARSLGRSLVDGRNDLFGWIIRPCLWTTTNNKMTGQRTKKQTNAKRNKNGNGKKSLKKNNKKWKR